MRNNYKRLGDYIELVDQRNEDLAIDILLGLSISKEFIPSVANTIGTNMKKYKIVHKNQFACSIMQVRRDGKMPVAILKSHDKAIISQAYPVFKVKDGSVLNPDYLMMWFKRKEFDREATFHAVGGVRGSLEWEDFMNFKLPVPPIEKQRQIVAEYNAVDNRIRINEQLNQKLEETAQAIYKHWFVDFEFPYLTSSGVEMPYKSSGGKMVYNEELDKEIPEGWEVKSLGSIISILDSKRIPLSKSEREKMKGIYPYYGAASLMDYVNNYIFDGTYILLGEDGTVMNDDRSPVLQYVWGKFWVNNHAHIITGKNSYKPEFIYMILKNCDVSSIITGGVQAKISQTNLKGFKILKSNDYLIKSFSLLVSELFNNIKKCSDENIQMKDLSNIILSKMSKIEVEKEVI